MTSSIRQIVAQQVPNEVSAEYGELVNACITALEEREAEIATALLEKAKGQGLSLGLVDEALRAVGLLPEPTPEPAVEEEHGVEEVTLSVEPLAPGERVRIKEGARNGGGVAVAERHIGKPGTYVRMVDSCCAGFLPDGAEEGDRSLVWVQPADLERIIEEATDPTLAEVMEQIRQQGATIAALVQAAADNGISVSV